VTARSSGHERVVGGRLLLVVTGLAMVAGTCAVAALAAKGQPEKKLTPQGQARARAVVIQRSDLLGAGWKGVRSTNPTSNPPNCRTYTWDLSDLTENGRAVGLVLSHGDTLSITSSAGVFVNEAQARSAYERFVKPTLVACLGELLGRALGPKARVTVDTGNQHALAVAPARAVDSHVEVTIRQNGQRVRAAMDVVFLQHGLVDAEFFAYSVGAPFPALEVRRLARAMAARMR
jgi:hypothetical protein